MGDEREQPDSHADCREIALEQHGCRRPDDIQRKVDRGRCGAEEHAASAQAGAESGEEAVVVEPDLATIHRESWGTLRQCLGSLFDVAHPGHPDSPAAAAGLLVSLDVIAMARVTEPDFMTGARASAIADAMPGRGRTVERTAD